MLDVGVCTLTVQGCPALAQEAAGKTNTIWGSRPHLE